jgi:hypothetical protein
LSVESSRRFAKNIPRIAPHFKPRSRPQRSIDGKILDAASSLTLVVDRSSSPPVSGERLRDGPAARIEGVKHGFGFILWLEDGYADCLEGYNWGEGSTVGLNFDTVRFELAAKPEDFPPLATDG